MPDLSNQFDAAMFSIYRRAKDEADYPANIFLGMLSSKGGVATAKYLINLPKPSDGYTALFERGRLDLTVEAEVLENSRWHSLFTEDELIRAHKRLASYNYVPKSSHYILHKGAATGQHSRPENARSSQGPAVRA